MDKREEKIIDLARKDLGVGVRIFLVSFYSIDTANKALEQQSRRKMK